MGEAKRRMPIEVEPDSGDDNTPEEGLGAETIAQVLKDFETVDEEAPDADEFFVPEGTDEGNTALATEVPKPSLLEKKPTRVEGDGTFKSIFTDLDEE